MRDFRLFFYKVGNGHCSYVEFPNGENGLIDVKVSHEESHDNVIKRLKAASISHLDYLFITHPHRDHITGLSGIVGNFSVGVFICSPVSFIPNPIYDDWGIYESMRKGRYYSKTYEVTEGWNSTIGDTRIDYIAPLKWFLRFSPVTFHVIRPEGFQAN